MLGPAEMREINDALAEERSDNARSEKGAPYLSAQFAMGMAMTRVATAGLKSHYSPFQFKR